MLNNIVLKLEDDYKIAMCIDEEVTKDLNMCGRGIGNQLEEVFVNPLADFIFEMMPTGCDTISINNIIVNKTKWIMMGSL